MYIKRLTPINLFTILTLICSSAMADGPLVRLSEVRQPIAHDFVTVVGYLQSKNTLSLSLPMDGTLTFSAEVGKRVEAGELLASIDDTEIVLKIAEQEAIIARETSLCDYYGQEVMRLEKLDRDQHTSKLRLAEWINNRDQASANLKIAKIRLQQLRDRRHRMKLYSPANGIVFKQLLQTGEQVTAGDTIVNIVDNTNLEVVAAVPVRHRARLISGVGTQVSADTFTTNARLDSVIPVGDLDTQQFEIRLSVNANVLDHWAIGHLLSVEVPLAANGFTSQVPRDALLRNKDHQYVLVITEEDVVREVKVDTGYGDGDWVAVNGELTELDRVVVRGGVGLKSGATVSVMNQ